MLLDSYTLKSGLTSLLPAPTPTGFVKLVNTVFTKIDTLLKTIQVRPSPPEVLVQAYLIHIADRSDVNFRRMLEIKGIKSKQEQNQLVELFQVHRSSTRYEPNLQASNSLFAIIQQSSNLSLHSSASAPTASSGPQVLVNLSTSAASSISNSTRFDPTLLGSAIISAAKDGVDRIGNPGLSSSTATESPLTSSSPVVPSSLSNQAQQENSNTNISNATANLNENLRNIGKFFRRDLGGFGGRFGRGGEDGSR
jgi:vacuolar protein sorting-associated protein 53